MLRRLHPLGAGQSAGQRAVVVDEHWEMLWADPELPVLVFERDERNLFSRAVARDALWFVLLSGGHGKPLSLLIFHLTT